MEKLKLHLIWLGPKEPNMPFLDTYKYLPEHDLIIWNDNNLMNINCKYFDSMISKRKYAFASDYLRFKILYELGGMYIDTDTEFIKLLPIEFLNNSFCATEFSSGRVASGLIMYFKTIHHPIIKKVLDYYESLDGDKFISDSDILIKCLLNYGNYELIDKDLIIKDIKIYKSEYFGPTTKNNIGLITNNTIAIHHYFLSWI